MMKEPVLQQQITRKNSFSHVDEAKKLAMMEKDKMDIFLKNQKKELY